MFQGHSITEGIESQFNQDVSHFGNFEFTATDMFEYAVNFNQTIVNGFSTLVYKLEKI